MIVFDDFGNGVFVTKYVANLDAACTGLSEQGVLFVRSQGELSISVDAWSNTHYERDYSTLVDALVCANIIPREERAAIRAAGDDAVSLIRLMEFQV